MSTQEQKTRRWKAFTSLNWYDGTIEFLFRFVAKTSEPLLAAGIVYSAADVLSKGHLGSTSPTMDNLWAISQALAIESSGGVVLVYGLQSLKEKDRAKACLYLILSALLAITGGVMLYMQLAGLENQQADSPLMRGLFALRCIVSVGYIYLCRTKSISFRNLENQQEATPAPEPPVPAPAQEQHPTAQSIDYQRLAQELAPLLQAVRTTIIEEVKASIAGPESEDVPRLPARRSNRQQMTLLIDAEKKQEQANRAGKLALPVNERLEAAYQELIEANPEQRISGRALAKKAHVDRQTCAAWLKATHPENMPGQLLAATASHPAREATANPGQPEVAATAIRPEAEATATELAPVLAATEPQPPVAATTGQSDETAMPSQPVITATATDQPQSNATATPPETATLVAATTTAASWPQAESAAIESLPEAEATATKPEREFDADLQPQIAATAEGQPETTTTEAATANQSGMDVPSTETATIDQSEPEATATEPPPETTVMASQPQPEVTAMKSEAEREETATSLRPRKKAGATATRKTTRPRPKATATRSQAD